MKLGKPPRGLIELLLYLKFSFFVRSEFVVFRLILQCLYFFATEAGDFNFRALLVRKTMSVDNKIEAVGDILVEQVTQVKH